MFTLQAPSELQDRTAPFEKKLLNEFRFPNHLHFFRILEHAVYLARHMAVTSDHHGKKMPLAGACCIFETPSSEAKNPSIVDSGETLCFFFLLGTLPNHLETTSFKWVKFQH